MEHLDAILRSWDSCEPDGIFLRTSELSKVFGLVTHQLRNPSLTPGAHQKLRQLLSVQGSGLPPLLRLLHINGNNGSWEVIHFVRFWQAFEEVHRMCASEDGSDLQSRADQEPIVEEIAEFRDALLRKLDKSSVTQALEGLLPQDLLFEELQRMRCMSVDPPVWEDLEESLRDACLAKASQEQISLRDVFVSILQWLRFICAEYVHGQKRTKIDSICNVAQCTRHDASLLLLQASWDEETALRNFFAVKNQDTVTTSQGASWSSQGARIKQDELECPICMEPFSGDVASGSCIQLRCCFKVVCRCCHQKLVNEQHMLNCPFCRTVDHVPIRACSSGGAQRRSGSLKRIFRTAERLACGANRTLANAREAGLSAFREVRDEIRSLSLEHGAQEARVQGRVVSQSQEQWDDYYRSLPRASVLPPRPTLIRA